MDQKFRSGSPFDGKPMKRFGEDSDAAALPAPPQIDEVVKAAEEVLEAPKEEIKHKCACGFPLELCHRFQGSPLAIMFYMAGHPDEYPPEGG